MVLDYGVASITYSKNSNLYIDKIKRLIPYYNVQTLVLDDINTINHKSKRVRNEIDRIETIFPQELRVFKYSRKQVRMVFLVYTKYDLSSKISEIYP